MAGDFVVHSNVGDDLLRVWVLKPGGYWRALIEFGDLTAAGTLYERYSGEELHLDTYFADLAASWRGWQGEKQWESLGLRLAATHDGLGHITIDATLQNDYAAGGRWRVRASLVVDAGTLDRLAIEAGELDRGPESA